MRFWDKIYEGDEKNALKDIKTIYQKQGYAVVNYLYFAGILFWKLMEKRENKNENQQLYKEAIMDGDFLLPDGIALQLLYKKHFKKKLHNINGTDFLPYFLQDIKKYDYRLILHGSYDRVIEKAKEYAEKELGLNVAHYAQGYNHEIPEKTLDKVCSKDRNCYNIMVICRQTTSDPIQEKWCYQNKELIKKYRLIVFNQAGTFEYWAGREKRAPKIIRNLKGEWVWRFITMPKKNYKKFFKSLFFVKLLLKKNL